MSTYLVYYFTPLRGEYRELDRFACDVPADEYAPRFGSEEEAIAVARQAYTYRGINAGILCKGE